MKEVLKKVLFDREEKQIDIFQLKEKHYGLSNTDKTIYYINETDSKLGFFAMYRHWLEYLYFADICGYMPVINVGKDFAYSENKPIMGKKNAFEYYFEQPAHISTKETMHSSKVVLSDEIHREMVELVFTGKRSHYDCNLRYMHFMGEMAHKYLRFNGATQAYIDEGVKKIGIGNEKILGVHIRGTDFKKKYDNHPVYVTETDVFKAIESIFERKNYEKIFVATDDQLMLEAFFHKYENKMCCYTDVLRSNDMKSVAFHENSRKDHKYKLGLEVIRDMYTLSKCDGLIAGISQVAICARINKLARKEKYQDIIIIDKGINKTGRQFYRHN